MLRKALADDPATLEDLVYGFDALAAYVRDNEAAFLNIAARTLPVLNDGILLVAKEIDALKAEIEARNDKPDTR